MLDSADILQECSFMNVSVINGQGEVDDIKISKGKHFIIPYGYGGVNFGGKMELIISYI